MSKPKRLIVTDPLEMLLLRAYRELPEWMRAGFLARFMREAESLLGDLVRTLRAADVDRN